ncbi:MAG: oxygen-independent coproporphyrinogen III oxidase [Flammeovirgaceae bacterium]|nr:oxygen-independent coproporphyrinogen III oxidase [Flammeovirgaceae bacterium]MBR06389.1 oxygen-independent coproporphyrinogen III oxidase [Rickettsiales bacterium]MBR11344.1 oxygen-independent coproporphyrinogen III oxidase [Rickettsiales bacterium]HCX21691.1 oxygen-independent coproporphyrinogen III oxidase [Cytophagales bacterium]|tara:strand:- start:3291 stop:4637 length:1347 start_codon:yes stop_codon:yes gene_type:complete
MENLIKKYNVPGPRYTSYPTVPFWEIERHTEANWKQSVKDGFWRSGKEISLYIHLPFCESLCTYCGCTTRITKNHSVETKYIQYLLKEWTIYLNTFGARPIVKEIHLGGGTPTFFSAENLELLIGGILENVVLADNYEFGFEGHPGNTTEAHLKTLSRLGFRRISLGIQDFDPEVQKTINRKQTFEQVQHVTELARKYGFKSVNFDLIYGLPKQTTRSVAKTIEQTIQLNPSRIAFYGYAHVPWIKAAQKSFEQYLPLPEERAAMYQLGKRMLTAAGYRDIGMDHFAQDQDKLFQAFDQGQLHRNFMGYTTQDTDLLIGLGMSSISDSWTAFSQNEKLLNNYYSRLDKGELPITKGHQLTVEDLKIRKHILNLMCKFETKWTAEELLEIGIGFNVELLNHLKDDGLIAWDEHGVQILDTGRPFIRNICMALDSRLWNAQKFSRFSQTV